MCVRLETVQVGVRVVAGVIHLKSVGTKPSFCETSHNALSDGQTSVGIRKICCRLFVWIAELSSGVSGWLVLHVFCLFAMV